MHLAIILLSLERVGLDKPDLLGEKKAGRVECWEGLLGTISSS